MLDAERAARVEETIERFTEEIRRTGGMHTGGKYQGKPIRQSPYWHRARQYLGLGEYDLAIQDLSEAIRLDPSYATLYGSRGGVYA